MGDESAGAPGGARGAGARPAERVPPALLVLGAVGSVQFGAALAKTLFGEVGAGGTVLLRVGLASLVLVALWRPRVRGREAGELWLAVAFGAALAGMNGSFYAALDRIPLGVAVTFEFVGPLAVALVGSRRALDLLWVALAAAGILLLSELGGTSLDATGIALALLAGGFWATYIVLGGRVGRAYPSGTGLTLAMVVAALLLLPVGIAAGGAELLEPRVLAIGAAVALLSSAIPYSLELEALRRLPAGVFGVLMSLEPAVATVAGFVVLGERLGARELAAVLLVVVASAGAARAARLAPRDA